MAEAAGTDPSGIVRKMQLEAETADILTRAWDRLGWIGASVFGGDGYREALRQWATAVLDEEKALAKDHLRIAIETVTRPDGFVP